MDYIVQFKTLPPCLRRGDGECTCKFHNLFVFFFLDFKKSKARNIPTIRIFRPHFWGRLKYCTEIPFQGALCIKWEANRKTMVYLTGVYANLVRNNA